MFDQLAECQAGSGKPEPTGLVEPAGGYVPQLCSDRNCVTTLSPQPSECALRSDTPETTSAGRLPGCYKHDRCQLQVREAFQFFVDANRHERQHFPSTCGGKHCIGRAPGA